MATGSISLSLQVGPTYTDIKGSGSVKAQVTAVSGSLPSGATVTGGSIRFTSIVVYSTRSPYWRITSPSDAGTIYAQTGGMSEQSAGFLRCNFDTPFSYDSILNYSVGDNIGLHFYGANNNTNCLNFRSDSATIVIDYSYDESGQYSASTGTLDKSSVDADGSSQITLNISGTTSVLSHTAVWSFGSYSSTSSVSVGTASATLTVPAAWNNAIPNATSGTASVTLNTYYGNTLIGSNTYSFTVNVPSSVVPTLDNPSAAINTSQINGIYIQGKSKVTITSGTASGAYSSTIDSYTITGSGLSYTGTSTSATSDYINDSGTRTYTVTVTDSRGRSATKTVSIYVYPYSPPSINSYSAFRTDSSGKASETGTSIQVICNCACSDLGSADNTPRNSVTWTWQYKKTTESSWTTGYSGLISGDTSRKDNIANTSNEYKVNIIVTDTVGTQSSIEIDVLVVGQTMFFKKGGEGIGIGMKTTKSVAAVELSPEWLFYHGTYTVPTYVYSSTTPTGATGLIWLKPVS